MLPVSADSIENVEGAPFSRENVSAVLVQVKNRSTMFSHDALGGLS